jgi:hypothetical protein
MSVNQSGFNPAYSQIKEIALFKADSSIYQNILSSNKFCKFERIEFIESIFELFPSGALIVRDTSDISTLASTVDSIEIVYLNGNSETFSITSVSYVNNAASETEDTFVSINFSNHLYKFCQDVSLRSLMNTTKPLVETLDALIETIMTKVRQNFSSFYPDAKLPTYYRNKATLNYILYKPLNPLEEKIEIASENFIQYLYYLSSMACEKNTANPNFLMWTGFNNEIYFKYFERNPNNDTQAIAKLNQNNLRYAIFNFDSQQVSIPRGGPKYNKIHILKTEPAEQYVSKKYYYIRKTPKILNKSTQTQNNSELLTFQFQDEGEKFDIELIGYGTLGYALPGADELRHPGHWGYYDSMVPENRLSLPSTLNQNLGISGKYKDNDFMGLNSTFPFIDNTEMWKNMFDLTPLHPNITSSGEQSGQNTQLQKVMNIRYETFAENLGISNSLERLRAIEKQNFIAYVLCCVQNVQEEEDEEETFFAELTGYIPDFTLGQLGVNDEYLQYLYSWKRLYYINSQFNGNPTNGFNPINPFRSMDDSTVWSNTDSEGNSEGSVEDIYNTYAINLNERSNFYFSTGPITGRYNPGWYAEKLYETPKVTYRPIGHRIHELQESDGNVFHVVRMTKTPYQKLLKQAGISSGDVYDYYAGKYFYTFSAENVTDGPCPENEVQ